MASMQKTPTSCKADEEEYEDYEEVEIEEDVEGEDYEEVFEEEDEEEVEQNEEEMVDYEEVEIEEDIEGEDYEEVFEEEDEEEVEQNEEEMEDYEEVEIEEDIEGEDYEEVFEEEVEEEIEHDEKKVEDEKKAIIVQKVQEEESVQDTAREEEKSANAKQPFESERNALPPPAVFPPLLKSVSDLETLHCALSKFLYQWNSLNRSLDSISAAIDAHAPSQHVARSTEQEKDERSEQLKEKDERSVQEKEKDESTEQEKEKDEQEKAKDDRSSVEILCEKMEGKALRKYLESNISDIDRLRHEVPEALRRLPNPEKLVFDAIGKFYREGRRAYNNNTPLVSIRRASIALLEFFVLSGRPTGDSSVKEEAMHEALFWWKRLVNGNIESAVAADSLGLILFLACFGIPKDFGSKDLCILLLKSDLNKKIDVFRRSHILMEKIPGAIKDLIKEEMHYEAAELSCCFGLTDTFPPLPLLSSFVAKVIQTGKLERQESQGLPNLVNESNIRELKSLKSFVKCLEDHKLDTHDLPYVNILKMISNLEKVIENDEMKLKPMILKRKSQHLKAADMKPEVQSKESFPSTSETFHCAPSQTIKDKPPSQPLFPDSKVGSSALSAAVGITKEYPYGWRRTYYDSSARYRASAQHFYQPQASAYENGGGISGRNLYKFADTVIQREAQLSKSIRSSNTSPAGAKFGRS